MNTSILRTAADRVKHWYIPLIVGIVLIIVGIDVLATPTTSYLALSVLFSISFLISGILQIIFSIANRQELNSWGWYLASGILYTLVGFLLVTRPGISITTLPFVVGFFVLFHSIGALGWAYDLKEMGIIRWGNVALAAVFGILFSFILLWNPGFAGLSLVIWTGIAFIAAGIAGIVLAMQLKKIKDLPGKLPNELRNRIESLKKDYQQAMHKSAQG
jgi:uncharacterized membrane protein HdeD (DUF308 family)